MMRFKTLSVLLVCTCIALAGAAASADEWRAAGLGYYNLDDFEAITGITIETWQESPMLSERVSAGELPPVETRLPVKPLVQVPWGEIGEYGGALRYSEFTINYDHYLRHIGTSHFLHLQPNETFHWRSGPYLGETQPGIFSHWDISEDARTFQFTILEGLKWSDGVSVTTADIEYYIEDVLLNEEITPLAPRWLRWGSEANEVVTEFTVLDDYRFEIHFSQPYPRFLYWLRSPSPHWTALLRPKHYVSQFHKDYVSEETLMPLMQAEGFSDMDDWGTFYDQVAGDAPAGGVTIRTNNVLEYPTLSPWVAVSVSETGDWVFERNPYYHMVDPEGKQLPYIDRLRRKYIAESEMVNLDIIAGNTDIQTQFIRIDDYPLYAANQESGNYRALPVKAWQHHVLIYILNYVPDDDSMRAVTQDVRFRQALSMALNREQIRETVFMGFGEAAQFAPPKDSPYYKEGMAEAYAEYDPEGAKALLDEMGLVDTTGDGWRNHPDGGSFTLPLEFYVVTPASVPGVEMAERYWGDIGVRVDARQVDGSYFWMIQGSNEHVATVWWADGPHVMDPHFLGLGVHTPQWRQWHTSGGTQGMEPQEWAKELLRARDTVESNPDEAAREAAAQRIWDLQTEYLPVIGSVVDPRTPLIHSADLSNVGIGNDLGFVNVMILDGASQWFFHNPDRR